MTDDSNEALLRALGGFRAIKFGRGVIAKTSYVAAAVISAWIVIILRLNNNAIFDGALITIGIVLTLFAIWFIGYVHNFAKKNPAQAILDGAQLLEFKRMELAAKGISSAPGTMVEVDRTINV